MNAKQEILEWLQPHTDSNRGAVDRIRAILETYELVPVDTRPRVLTRPTSMKPILIAVCAFVVGGFAGAASMRYIAGDETASARNTAIHWRQELDQCEKRNLELLYQEKQRNGTDAASDQQTTAFFGLLLRLFQL